MAAGAGYDRRRRIALAAGRPGEVIVALAIFLVLMALISAIARWRFEQIGPLLDSSLSPEDARPPPRPPRLHRGALAIRSDAPHLRADPEALAAALSPGRDGGALSAAA
jgi:hypothetical protein